MAALGALPLPISPRLDGIGEAALARIREQARVQDQARHEGRRIHEFVTPVEPDKGLAALPESSDADVFFDLEGDALHRGRSIREDGAHRPELNPVPAGTRVGYDSRTTPPQLSAAAPVPARLVARISPPPANDPKEALERGEGRGRPAPRRVVGVEPCLTNMRGRSASPRRSRGLSGARSRRTSTRCARSSGRSSDRPSLPRSRGPGGGRSRSAERACATRRPHSKRRG